MIATIKNMVAGTSYKTGDDILSYNYEKNRPRKAAESLNYWKWENEAHEIARSTLHLGKDSKIDTDRLCETINDLKDKLRPLEQELDEAKSKICCYQDRIRKIETKNSQVAARACADAKRAEKQTKLAGTLTKHLSSYGDHLSTCNYVEMLSIGRQADESCCNCGWNKVQKEKSI